MFKRCLIVVLMVVSGCCAWGQSRGNENINYDDLTWTSWSGSRTYSLFGKIYVAKPGEKVDLTVRIEKRKDWGDIGVAITNDKDVHPGQWRFVGTKDEADLSIRFVKMDEDFSVEFISMAEWQSWWNGILSWP